MYFYSVWSVNKVYGVDDRTQRAFKATWLEERKNIDIIEVGDACATSYMTIS